MAEWSQTGGSSVESNTPQQRSMTASNPINSSAGRGISDASENDPKLGLGPGEKWGWVTSPAVGGGNASEVVCMGNIVRFLEIRLEPSKSATSPVDVRREPNRKSDRREGIGPAVDRIMQVLA